ncbi:hypothetical protein FKM82_006903 [Ascaphus truei]
MDEVYVSHVEDAVTFWAQAMNSIHDISKLSEKLASVCPTASSGFGVLDLDKMYGGLFSLDQCWYRCKLQRVVNDEQCAVTYMDYGNAEILNRSSIVELPEDLQFPAIAQKYRLWGLQLQTCMDVEPGLTFLSSLISEKLISVQKKATYRDSTIVVQALYGSIDIGEEMAKKGFAERCKIVNGSNSAEEKPEVLENSVTMPLPWASRRLERPPMREPKTIPMPNRCSSDQRVDSWKENYSSNNLPSTRVKSFTNINVSTMNSDQKLLDENKKLKEEKEALLKKSNTLESRLQQLNLEFEKENEEAFQRLEKSLQSAIGNKLKSVTSKIEVLKTVRRSNENLHFGDDLLEAVRVVTEERLCAPSSLNTLDESWMEYNFAQEMIQQCPDLTELDMLIATRNQVQQTLYSSIEAFILEVDQLPLDVRATKLQALLGSLEVVYGESGESDSSDNVFDEFCKWKQVKMEQFNCVRYDTNNSLEILSTWFSDITEFFDLTSDATVGSSEVVRNIDDILNQVESNIRKELDISLVEQDEADRKIILNAYNRVVERIHQELQLNGVVRCKHSSSVEFKKKIDEWLNRIPNVDQLMSIKKTIKGLKAQLRWKLVERGSLEESEECEETTLAKLKDEAAVLRNRIFYEICQEQEEFGKLSSLVQKWFPELPLLHPEAGILNYMNSGGLVSVSLERDLLDAEPMKELSSKRPLVRAEFQNQMVLLKGYSVGVDTEERVIERAAKYQRARSELEEESGLMRLLFLFFCKSNPLAYLMVPFYSGESLGSLQANKCLNSLEIVKVMSGVAKGLQTLHAASIVVGSLHENNMFAVNRERGLVGDFDFTKDAEQRIAANSAVWPCLTAPEIKQGQPASTSSDMYTYGCILLWLCIGKTDITIKEDGTPNINGLDLDAKVKSLLSGLICCADRMRADQVKNHEYFHWTEAVDNAVSDPDEWNEKAGKTPPDSD